MECGRLSELGRSCSSLLSCSVKCTSVLQTVDARTMGTRLESGLQPRGSAGATVGSSVCVFVYRLTTVFNSGPSDIMHLFPLTISLFVSARSRKAKQIRAFDFGLAHRDLPEDLVWHSGLSTFVLRDFDPRYFDFCRGSFTRC